MTTSLVKESLTHIFQWPALPWEITETIIDHLHSDIEALGACGSVCSEWLARSRHHLFYTVQLWPWRVQTFYELANKRYCTFTNYVRRIEMDDLRIRTKDREQGCVLDNGIEHSVEWVPCKKAMSRPHPPCFAGVHSIQIRNVDWTSLPIAEQVTFRVTLASFSKLNRLEFQDVIFLDLCELLRIVNSIPSLHHLSANVSFMKYLEHTLASASTMSWPNNLRSFETGTEEGLPVMLSCMMNDPGHVSVLKLLNLKSSHLLYLKKTLKKLGKKIQHLVLGFDSENANWANQGIY